MIKNTELTYCTKCCLDGSVVEITYDENGVCNFCHSAKKALAEIELEKPNLEKWIKRIKQDGRGKKYDILFGLSGGVDSSTALHYAVKFGLRPFCFTMDNGYNDPKADENILKLVETLKVPLYRYALDLDKFRELQGAYLRSGVINIEATYDHLLMAATYEMANKYNIKWIISGGNVTTESIMPAEWSYTARDLVNLKDIYKKMTGKNIKNIPNKFPLCGTIKWNWYHWIKRIRIFYLLDYLDYNRLQSEQMLIKEYGYESTGEKHEENIFTRWYQAFYLFEKYGIDKRKAHYSSLINSKQMTREEAREKLALSPIYPILGIEQRVLNYAKLKHEDFRQDWLYPLLTKIIRYAKKYTRKMAV